MDEEVRRRICKSIDAFKKLTKRAWESDTFDMKTKTIIYQT